VTRVSHLVLVDALTSPEAGAGPLRWPAGRPGLAGGPGRQVGGRARS